MTLRQRIETIQSLFAGEIDPEPTVCLVFPRRGLCRVYREGEDVELMPGPAARDFFPDALSISVTTEETADTLISVISDPDFETVDWSKRTIAQEHERRRVKSPQGNGGLPEYLRR
jgi:hypothetical protein